MMDCLVAYLVFSHLSPSGAEELQCVQDLLQRICILPFQRDCKKLTIQLQRALHDFFCVCRGTPQVRPHLREDKVAVVG
jgi:hypothetical protein